MAGLDKIYATSWDEYQEIVNWAKEHKFTCPNGMVIDPLDYIYDKEDFKGNPIPIMNTPQSVDYFLIKYCPIKLIQDRMKEVYSEQYINAVKEEKSVFDKFIRPESGTKFKMIQNSKFRNKKPLSFYGFNNKKNILVHVSVKYENELLNYNKDYDTFIFDYELNPGSYSIYADLKCKSLKAILRKFKKWNLPKGAIIIIEGKYIGETWKYIVK